MRTVPDLNTRLLFPVLVSSVFLQIEKLVVECVRFWANNFDKIMREERIPVTQLDLSSMSKLCEAVKLEELLALESDHMMKKQKAKNGEMLERIWMH